MQLYNEASPAFQSLLKDKCIGYQLDPPGMHRCNAAERAIITLNDHFIAGIYATDPDFRMQNWDRLLEQAEITLNLLRPSRLNPRLPAYAQLNGEFDFNCTPMANTGTITLVHDKPHNRGTWPPNGHAGWYISPVMLHYRCLTSYIPNTEEERVCDTTEFPP